MSADLAKSATHIQATDPAAEILAEVFRDQLAMSERMRSIGKFSMARVHLNTAMDQLNDLERLTKEKIVDAVFTPLT